MTSISVTQARNNLAEILNQLVYQAENFVIRHRGEPVAVLVSSEKLKKKRTDYRDGKLLGRYCSSCILG